VSVHPNAHSYTAVIEAYANGGAPNAAQQADAWCREMVRTFQKGDSSVVPTSRAFQAALSAHAKSGEPDSGQRAQQLMDLQEQLWREHRIDECKPTKFNYHALIMAWVNSPDAGSAQNARRVLQKLEDSFRSGDADMKPTTVTYNAVIDAYAKAAEKRNLDDPTSSPGEPNDGSPESQAEELLRHMEGLHRTGANADARPNVRSFNSVLNVWAKSGRADAADRAQEILTLMESMYQSGNEEVRPDVHSFCTVINGTHGLLTCWLLVSC
jgi:PPR repeat